MRKVTSAAERVVLIASEEFTLKSRPVRRSMEERLVHDVRYSLTRAGFSGFGVQKVAARLVVRGLPDVIKAAQICSGVFGVAYASAASSVPPNVKLVVDNIVETAKSSVAPGQTFAVRAHRSAPTSLSRKEVEIEGGAAVLQALDDLGVRVSLNQPDATIFAQLAGERVYVYSKKISGPGGLPISSQWKMLGILDSGVLSLLAGYAMLRRGCLVELLIPTSYRGAELFDRERQLRLARIFRNIIPRESYRSFTLCLNEDTPETHGPEPLEHAQLRARARIAGMIWASKKFYKGVVLADVSGPLRTDFARSRSPQRWTPIFQPLIGLDGQALQDLSDRLGISNEELRSAVEREERLYGLETVRAVPYAKSEPAFEQISL